jgi:cytidine deaminase
MIKNLTLAYEEFEHYSELNERDQLLLKKANEVVENAYAPYSKFKVGASVLLENGEIILGSNQENIAYPSGLCAERVALFYAGANFPQTKVDTICIVAKGDLIPKDHLLSPCGSCRQVMSESEMRQNKPFRVILVSQNNKVLVFNSALDLLPFAFGK